MFSHSVRRLARLAERRSPPSGAGALPATHAATVSWIRGPDAARSGARLLAVGGAKTPARPERTCRSSSLARPRMLLAALERPPLRKLDSARSSQARTPAVLSEPLSFLRSDCSGQTLLSPQVPVQCRRQRPDIRQGIQVPQRAEAGFTYDRGEQRTRTDRRAVLSRWGVCERYRKRECTHQPSAVVRCSRRRQALDAAPRVAVDDSRS